MEFTGEMTFAQNWEQVWQKLTDVRFLVQCIPGAEKITEEREDHAVCTLRPGFAFVRGTLEVSIERTQADLEKKQVQFQLISKGIGSSSEVASQLTFFEQKPGTQVTWKAEVQKLGGLLKAVPQGLIRGAAQKTINDVWANVQTKLTNPTPGVP